MSSAEFSVSLTWHYQYHELMHVKVPPTLATDYQAYIQFVVTLKIIINVHVCDWCVQMAAVVGFSILFNIPRYLDDDVMRKPDGSLAIERTYIGNDDTFKLVYAGVFYILVIYALPVIILTGMTYRLLSSSCSNSLQTSGSVTVVNLILALLSCIKPVVLLRNQCQCDE